MTAKKPFEVYSSWLARFEGTLTQGPNAGVTYSKATSWGGCLYPTSEAALAGLENMRSRDPELTYFLVERRITSGTRVTMQEITHIVLYPGD